jgi:hypothetical protein
MKERVYILSSNSKNFRPGGYSFSASEEEAGLSYIS